MTYIPRLADGELAARLRRSGAVLIEGAKWCGKTETATRAAGSVVHVDTDPDVAPLMDIDPNLVLEGAPPRLLDEWQWQLRLWDVVRHAVDERKQPGQFVLTGSATRDKKVRRHSGAGRFSVLRMRPLSLWESGVSSGAVSLRELRAGGDVVPAGPVPASLDDVIGAILRGGWPATARLPLEDARQYVLDYLDLLADADISQAEGVRRDPVRVRQLLASLGRNTATTASLSTMVADAAGADGALTADTASGYLRDLERLMIAEEQPAWSTALRDAARLRRAAKRHLVCPSLAAAAMGATAAKLKAEPNTLGNLFESLVVRDLRVYAQGDRGGLFHYRDSSGREIDAVIEYPDGWVACEIKLGTGAVEAAAASLSAAVAAIDTQTVGGPDAMLVITGGGPTYRRPDGIVVVPITALKD